MTHQPQRDAADWLSIPALALFIIALLLIASV